MPGGRPSSYTTWKVKAICTRIMRGESLRSICDRKYYPPRSCVHMWLIKYKEFADQYTKAREVQQEYHLDEMLEIADDGSNDWMKRNDPENDGYKVNGEHVNRSRLRVDTRKWIMERMAPKKYGARQQIEHSGGVSDLSEAEIDKRLQRLLDAAK